MSLAFYFSPTSVMSAQQYDECIKRLTKAGAAHPPGRVYHSAFGTADSLAVFDVWTSQAAFEAFGATLMPILQDLGVDPGQPAVMPVHNVIMPPAARPRPTAKRAPAKRATAKRAAKRAPAKKSKARGRAKKGKKR
jgi:hypothetical protein